FTRGWIQAAQIAPDDFALVEHGGFQLGIGPGARHAFTQGLQSPPLQQIAPNGAGSDRESRQRHECKSKQEFALEGHLKKLTDTANFVRRERLMLLKVEPQMNADNRRYAHDDLTRAIIGVFFEVYNELGYGF